MPLFLNRPAHEPDADRRELHTPGPSTLATTAVACALGISETEAGQVLASEEELRRVIADVAKQPNHVRREVLFAFSGVSLPAPLERELYEGLASGILTPKPHGLRPGGGAQNDANEPEQTDTLRMPVPCALGPQQRPTLQTYLANGEYGRVECPRGFVEVLAADGRVSRIIELSREQTAYLLVMARECLSDVAYSVRRAASASDESGKSGAKGSTGDRKYLRFRTAFEPVVRAALTASSAGDPLVRDDEVVQVRFRQYKVLPSVDIARLLEGHALTDLLENVYGAHGHEPAKLLKLSEIDGYLSPESVVIREPNSSSDIPSFSDVPHTTQRSEMNELQKAHIAFCNATRSGGWTPQVIEKYVEYLEYLPAHLCHVVAALETLRRLSKGELNTLPKRCLSIASGPHEELRAQLTLERTLTNYHAPEVVSADLSGEMLEMSRKASPHLDGRGSDFVHSMTSDVPEEHRTFYDLVECSSFDNLKTSEDVRMCFRVLFGAARDGGLLRLMAHHGLSDELCGVLRAHRCIVHEQGARLALDDATIDTIRKNKGPEWVARIKQKLGRHQYILIELPVKLDRAALEKAMDTVEPFAARAKVSSRRVADALADAFRSAGVEDEEKLLHVCLAVVRAPRLFLNQRMLDPELMQVALEYVTPSLDPRTARQIYEAFFKRASDPSVDDVAHHALSALLSVPGMERELGHGLLAHPNAAVRQTARDCFARNVDLVLGPLLLDRSLPIPERVEVLRRCLPGDAADKACAVAFGILKTSGRGEEIRAMLEALPEDVGLRLPVWVRLDPELRNVLERKGLSREVSSDEIREIFVDNLDVGDRSALIDRAADTAVGRKDSAFALALLSSIPDPRALFEEALFHELLELALRCATKDELSRIGLLHVPRGRMQHLHGEALERALETVRISVLDVYRRFALLELRTTKQLHVALNAVVCQAIESGVPPKQAYEVVAAPVPRLQERMSWQRRERLETMRWEPIREPLRAIYGRELEELPHDDVAAVCEHAERAVRFGYSVERAAAYLAGALKEGSDWSKLPTKLDGRLISALAQHAVLEAARPDRVAVWLHPCSQVRRAFVVKLAGTEHVTGFEPEVLFRYIEEVGSAIRLSALPEAAGRKLFSLLIDSEQRSRQAISFVMSAISSHPEWVDTDVCAAALLDMGVWPAGYDVSEAVELRRNLLAFVMKGSSGEDRRERAVRAVSAAPYLLHDEDFTSCCGHLMPSSVVERVFREALQGEVRATDALLRMPLTTSQLADLLAAPGFPRSSERLSWVAQRYPESVGSQLYEWGIEEGSSDALTVIKDHWERLHLHYTPDQLATLLDYAPELQISNGILKAGFRHDPDSTFRLLDRLPPLKVVSFIGALDSVSDQHLDQLRAYVEGRREIVAAANFPGNYNNECRTFLKVVPSDLVSNFLAKHWQHFTVGELRRVAASNPEHESTVQGITSMIYASNIIGRTFSKQALARLTDCDLNRFSALTISRDPHGVGYMVSFTDRFRHSGATLRIFVPKSLVRCKINPDDPLSVDGLVLKLLESKRGGSGIGLLSGT